MISWFSLTLRSILVWGWQRVVVCSCVRVCGCGAQVRRYHKWVEVYLDGQWRHRHSALPLFRWVEVYLDGRYRWWVLVLRIYQWWVVIDYMWCFQELCFGFSLLHLARPPFSGFFQICWDLPISWSLFRCHRVVVLGSCIFPLLLFCVMFCFCCRGCVLLLFIDWEVLNLTFLQWIV